MTGPSYICRAASPQLQCIQMCLQKRIAAETTCVNNESTHDVTIGEPEVQEIKKDIWVCLTVGYP